MSYDDDDDLDDYNSESDSDDSDVTIACPYCGEEMYDDTEQCPHCGQYISVEDRPYEGKPAWIVVVILLCVAMMVLGVIVSL